MFGIDVLVGIVLGSLLFGSYVFTLSIAGVLNSDSVKDTVVKKFPEAFKILIKQKKTKSVNVGIFNKSDYEIKSDVKIEAKERVDDSIYVGQVIYV